MSERPIPLVDDLALDAVSWIRHRTTQRIVSVPVAGLAGDVQQRLGRGSHEIHVGGVLVGAEVVSALESLQQKAAAGEEVPFSADISTALSLDKVVVVDAMFEEAAGRPGRYEYELLLRESPPLPPPAELEPFGGLDGFDVGFDTDILGDIAAVAGAIQDAIDQVTDVIGQLESLASLADFAVGNPLAPIQEAASKLDGLGDLAGAANALVGLLGGG